MRLQRGTLFLGLILSWLTCSCSSDVANRYYGNGQLPPKNPKEVAVLSQNPTRPYTILADFQARGVDSEWMQEQAAKIGADAVIVRNLGGYYDRGEEWAGGDAQSGTAAHVVGTAIKYK